MKVKVILDKSGIKAKGLYDSTTHQLTVLEGSQISQKKSNHFIGSLYDHVRSNLKERNVIKNFVFTRDYPFRRPSPAATVILGSGTNGNMAWLTEDGGSIKFMNRSKPEINPSHKPEIEKMMEMIYEKCDDIASEKLKKISNELIGITQKIQIKPI